MGARWASDPKRVGARTGCSRARDDVVVRPSNPDGGGRSGSSPPAALGRSRRVLGLFSKLLGLLQLLVYQDTTRLLFSRTAVGGGKAPLFPRRSDGRLRWVCSDAGGTFCTRPVASCVVVLVVPLACRASNLTWARYLALAAAWCF